MNMALKRQSRRIPDCLTAGSACCAVCLGLLGFACAEARAEDTAEGTAAVAIKAAEIHLGTGEVVRDGVVLVRDGRIVDVGADVSPPAGTKVIEVTGGSVTPGLIDANAAVEPTDRMMLRHSSGMARKALHDFFCPHHPNKPMAGCCGSTCSRALMHVSGETCPECGFPNAAPSFAPGTQYWRSRAEESSEVIPQTRVIDSVNLRSVDFDRLLSGGVTTVFITPDSSAVISSRGAIVRTGGPIQDRVVRESDAVKAVVGSDPYSRGPGNHLPFRQFVTFHARRPTTRMGVAWVFRKAMYDAQRHAAGIPVSGADTPDTPALEVLQQVLDGQVPLRIQARMQHDILTAFRLTDEFGLSFVMEEATEAQRCLGAIKAHGTPVVYGPIFVHAPGYRALSGEVYRARLNTMKALLDAGVETALTAHELRDEDGLARQAMYAMRFGVGRDAVMRSVTQIPAKLLRLDDQIGTLAVGNQADILVWNGRPFEAASKPIVVMIGGDIVLDRRTG